MNTSIVYKVCDIIQSYMETFGVPASVEKALNETIKTVYIASWEIVDRPGYAPIKRERKAFLEREDAVKWLDSISKNRYETIGNVYFVSGIETLNIE